MMKQQIAETSRKAYQEIKENGTEKSQAQRILEAIQKSDKPLTANELNNGPLADLDIPNGRISARLNRLKDNDEIREAEKREDSWTGRKAKTWTDTEKEAVFQ